MNRLTKRIDGYAHGAEGRNKDKLTGDYCRGEFEATACVEKLAEYEDLEEQGKLLKLPCAVGDTVYLVSFRKKCYKMGNTYLVNNDLECAFCESECVCGAKKEYFIEEIKATLPIIGNMIEIPNNFMVFLTRQEAEDKLAETEGKK